MNLIFCFQRVLNGDNKSVTDTSFTDSGALRLREELSNGSLFRISDLDTDEEEWLLLPLKTPNAGGEGVAMVKERRLSISRTFDMVGLSNASSLYEHILRPHFSENHPPYFHL